MISGALLGRVKNLHSPKECTYFTFFIPCCFTFILEYGGLEKYAQYDGSRNIRIKFMTLFAIWPEYGGWIWE